MTLRERLVNLFLSKHTKYEKPIIQVYSGVNTIIYYDYNQNQFLEGKLKNQKWEGSKAYYIVIPLILFVGYTIDRIIGLLSINIYLITVIMLFIIHFITVYIYNLNWIKHQMDNEEMIIVDCQRGQEYAYHGKHQYKIQIIILVLISLSCVLMFVLYMVLRNILILVLYACLYMIRFFLWQGFKPIKKYKFYRNLTKDEVVYK